LFLVSLNTKRIEMAGSADRIVNMKIKEVRHLLTYDCNLRCKHCYLSAGEHNVKTLPFTKEESDDFYGFFNPEVVSATGGEPLLELELVKIIAKSTANYGGGVELVTNGHFITERIVSELNRLNDKTFYQISLDGLEPYHNYIRGNINAYMDAFNAIDICSASGRTTKARMTVTSENADQIPKIIQLLDIYQRDNIHLVMRPVIELGRAKDNDLKFGERSFRDLDSYAELAEFTTVETTDNSGKCGCGIDTIAIDPKGDIYPCTYFTFDDRYRMGNFFSGFREMGEHKEFQNFGGGCYARQRAL
jgi:MoaA/NifB/PqqE/SkfB family radical SAM enzyme